VADNGTDQLATPRLKLNVLEPLTEWPQVGEVEVKVGLPVP
jgi:hypothetical protein